MDNAWEQGKLEATLREMLVNRAESLASSARFVGGVSFKIYHLAEKDFGQSRRTM